MMSMSENMSNIIMETMPSSVFAYEIQSDSTPSCGACAFLAIVQPDHYCSCGMRLGGRFASGSRYSSHGSFT